MNTSGSGKAIAKIINSSKMKNKEKKMKGSDNDSCHYCFKKTTPANKARHEKICSVKKAGLDKNSTLLYVVDDPKLVPKFDKEIVVKDNEHIQQIPKRNTRSILYVTGASGSGKSYYTKNWTNEYIKMYPKNPIYVFSALKEDPSLDSIKKLKRINLDEKFLECELTLNDLKNSLLIFDDIDVISNKAIKNKINNILDTLLQTGRHSGTSVVYTTHCPCSSTATKMILQECHSVTIFPAGNGGRSLKYLLESYYGLDKSEISRIKKLPTRWVTIIKGCPMSLLYEGGAYLLNQHDD
jgi:chromosomal replication initiation ATPase DnaA